MKNKKKKKKKERKNTLSFAVDINQLDLLSVYVYAGNVNFAAINQAMYAVFCCRYVVDTGFIHAATNKPCAMDNDKN